MASRIPESAYSNADRLTTSGWRATGPRRRWWCGSVPTTVLAASSGGVFRSGRYQLPMIPRWHPGGTRVHLVARSCGARRSCAWSSRLRSRRPGHHLDRRLRSGIRSPRSADLAPRRSVLTIRQARGARFGQSVALAIASGSSRRSWISIIKPAVGDTPATSRRPAFWGNGGAERTSIRRRGHDVERDNQRCGYVSGSGIISGRPAACLCPQGVGLALEAGRVRGPGSRRGRLLDGVEVGLALEAGRVRGPGSRRGRLLDGVERRLGLGGGPSPRPGLAPWPPAGRRRRRLGLGGGPSPRSGLAPWPPAGRRRGRLGLGGGPSPRPGLAPWPGPTTCGPPGSRPLRAPRHCRRRPRWPPSSTYGVALIAPDTSDPRRWLPRAAPPRLRLLFSDCHDDTSPTRLSH